MSETTQIISPEPKIALLLKQRSDKALFPFLYNVTVRWIEDIGIALRDRRRVAYLIANSITFIGAQRLISRIT